MALRTAELQVRSSTTEREYEADRTARSQRFVLGIVSLGAGIPITGIAGALVDPGLAGVLIVWAGIVGVNIAAAWGNRQPLAGPTRNIG